MAESDEFWDFYWEVRLQLLEDLGKREAILAASRLVRGLAGRGAGRARLLELGCGEGQIIGALVGAHAQELSPGDCTGVDHSQRSIEVCRRSYPEMQFIEGDFTDPVLMSQLGQFNIVLMVNALHEVFSAGYSPVLGEIDTPAARKNVERALEIAVKRVIPGGYLALFDGLEPPGNPDERLRVRFQHWQARRRFDLFAAEYRPFRITYREVDGPLCVELSQRDFTRYIDKSIFLEKKLWQTERMESYQYFTEADFEAAFARLGMQIQKKRAFTVNYEKWRSEVEIETPGVDFPVEHILIIARKKDDQLMAAVG